LRRQGHMPKRPACVKTVVTTPLFRAIADDYGVACFDVLPGFKYISAKIHEWEMERGGENFNFIFGGEESYGYLYGTASRDKDAVISCALLCEVALEAKRQGKTLADLLDDLYHKYGVYREELISMSYPETREGRERMHAAMKNLRQQPLTALDGIQVTSFKDHRSEVVAADMLAFTFADGCWLVVRPSGTEPKVKLYAGISAQPVGSSLGESVKACDQRLVTLLQKMKLHLG
jgi:phosphomannomutase